MLQLRKKHCPDRPHHRKTPMPTGKLPLPLKSIDLVCQHAQFSSVDLQQLILQCMIPSDHNEEFSPIWRLRNQNKLWTAVLSQAELERMGHAVDQLATTTTAEIGDLYTLQWLVANGYTIHPSTAALAATRNGYVNIVEWLGTQYGLLAIDFWLIVGTAAMFEHQGILEWASQQTWLTSLSREDRYIRVEQLVGRVLSNQERQVAKKILCGEE